MPQYLKLDEAASELAKKLGENCRERRAQLKMSQAELSQRSGIAASHLSYIEHGKANPTLEILEHLAEGLSCSVLDLLSTGAKK
jgi:transcriptional regulator with XRE-family HTH domain